VTLKLRLTLAVISWLLAVALWFTTNGGFKAVISGAVNPNQAWLFTLASILMFFFAGLGVIALIAPRRPLDESETDFNG